MNEHTNEWVEKAESDYRISLLAAKATDPTEPDAVCFHAQQCIEKYAKAFLTEHDVPFPKTHSMTFLFRQCVEVDTAFDIYKKDFEDLDEYSVDIRYPGDDASEEDAKKSVESMKRVRIFIRQKLNLETEGNEPEK